MTLHLVRHTSVKVEAGVCYGQSDVPLSESFALEARAVREHLASLLMEAIPEVYSSPLSRCLRLAEYCGYTEVRLEPRLLELNFGAWELQRFDEIDDPNLNLWYEDYIFTRPTDGESWAEQCFRVSEWLTDLAGKIQTADSDRVVVAFAHAGVLRAAKVWMGEVDMKSSFDYRPAYGEILTLRF